MWKSNAFEEIFTGVTQVEKIRIGLGLDRTGSDWDRSRSDWIGLGLESHWFRFGSDVSAIGIGLDGMGFGSGFGSWGHLGGGPMFSEVFYLGYAFQGVKDLGPYGYIDICPFPSIPVAPQ